MEKELQKLKKFASNNFKTEKQIEKGKDICRNITIILNIYDDEKIIFGKKVKLLTKYIPRIRHLRKLDESILLNIVTESVRLQSEKCTSFLNSIKITKKKDVKNFIDNLKKSIVHVSAPGLDICLSNDNLSRDILKIYDDLV